MRTKLPIALATLCVLAVSGLPAAAQADKAGFNLRLNGTLTDPKRTNASGDLVRVEAITAESLGLALSGEFRISRLLGVEVGVQGLNNSEVRLSSTDPSGRNLGDELADQPRDDLSYTLVDAALNVYLSSGMVDFYVGPVLGYIFYDDLDVLVGNLSVPATIEIDDDVAFGAVLGMDIDISDSDCFFTSSLKYLWASYDAQNRLDGSSQEVDLNPWIVRVGFGYRF
jgi:outer membrane protein